MAPFFLQDNLRTRRPGGRIPHGVPFGKKPAILVIVGFSCIHAGLPPFFILLIWNIPSHLRNVIYRPKHTFLHMDLHMKTGPTEGRFFYSSHHQPVSLRTPATAASSWCIRMSTWFPLTPASSATYALSTIITVAPVGMMLGSVATQLSIQSFR